VKSCRLDLGLPPPRESSEPAAPAIASIAGDTLDHRHQLGLDIAVGGAS
jgi:hypothetical protein